MQHNILLLFLSDVKVVKDAEQGGKKLSEPANYPGIGKTMTTNESAVRYLAQENEKNSAIVRLDKIFAFATNKIRKLYVGQKNAEDENWAKDAVDEKGNKLTHLDYFKYRLRTEGIIDGIDSCITEDDAVAGTVGTICPFDEETDDVKQTMMTIVGMANRIQAYIQSLPPGEQEEVVLHADMTGGFRHASMMMLAVMRLMQYQGVKIGHVVYSNYNWDLKEGTVQEIGDIYHMFDLVAGAEEFVTFGSVNTIQTYFNCYEKSPNLAALLKAMEGFAEAIKLSRRKDFAEAMENLKTSLQNFDRVRNTDDLNDRLMGLLEKRVKQDYKNVLSDEKDVLTPVAWCLEHGYLQQALTLYTESIPDFLFASNILWMEPETYQAVEKAKPETDRRDTVFFLFSDYAPEYKILRSESFAKQKEVKDSIIAAAHDVLKAIGASDEDASRTAQKHLQDLLESFKVDPREIICFNNVLKGLETVKKNPKLIQNPDEMEPEVKIPLQNILEKYKNVMDAK